MDAFTRSFLLRPDLVPAIDISKWQGKWADPLKTRRLTDVLFMRGANGVRKDSRLDEYNHWAGAHGFRKGVYVFLRPKIDPVRQADFIVKLTEDYGMSLAPMIDVEHADGKSRGYQQEHLVKVLGRVEQQLGVKPFIYTAAWFWNKNIGYIPNQREYPLHVARYFSMKSGPPENTDEWARWCLATGKSVHIPVGFREYGALQFSADGNNWGRKAGFSSSHLDLNLITPEFLNAIALDGRQIQVTPAPVEESKPRLTEKLVRSLRKGARGDDVKALQTILAEHAPVHPGPVDGRFGPRTEASLRSLQAKLGLTIDGWAGQQTFRRLREMGL